LYIWLAPETSGRHALRENGELNVRGYIALICGLAVFAYALPHLVHVLLRRPALEINERELQIWMLPYERIPLAEISQVLVDDSTVEILRNGKRPRRINTAILHQPRAFFFDDLGERLPNKEMVQEK
jgi:hypothetical protein